MLGLASSTSAMLAGVAEASKEGFLRCFGHACEHRAGARRQPQHISRTGGNAERRALARRKSIACRRNRRRLLFRRGASAAAVFNGPRAARSRHPVEKFGRGGKFVRVEYL